jgi:acylphosphatase
MQTIPAKARVRLRIRGRVQGVYFRASTVQRARQLGVTGWVTNCLDGSVEVLAEGASEQLDELVAWCHRGPTGARVEAVDLDRQDFRGEFDDFHVRKSSD